MADRKHSDLASVMYPALSREAKAEEQRQARMQSEQRARSKRTVENLQSVLDALRREREQ
jgi:hypothetical protein